jgi:hypothetical protein
LAMGKLTLILLPWRIGWAPNNASRWEIGYNSACKGLRDLHYELLEHPPYSPDLAPSDFYLIQKLNSSLLVSVFLQIKRRLQL